MLTRLPIPVCFDEIGGVSQFAFKAQVLQHFSNVAHGHTSDSAIVAFVISLLANGSLIDVLDKNPITGDDLFESLSLFRTACALVKCPWRTDSRVIALQVMHPPYITCDVTLLTAFH